MVTKKLLTKVMVLCVFISSLSFSACKHNDKENEKTILVQTESENLLSEISSLSAGNYQIEISGQMTDEIFLALRSFLLENPDVKVALDFSNTEGMTELPDNAFYSGDLSNVKTASVTKIILPESVTQIGAWAFAFSEHSLKSVVAPGVTVLKDHVFRNCWDLESVEFADKMESIGDSAFEFCTSLKEVTLNAESIGKEIFALNEKLTKITIGPHVQEIADPLARNMLDSLENIEVDQANTNFKTINGVLYDIDGERLIRCPTITEFSDFTLPETVKSIDEYAFSSCKTVKSFTSKNITTIPYCLFWLSEGIESVNLEGVEIIAESAFCKCKNLKSIYLPDGLKRIGMDVFSEDKKISSIYVPDSVVYIGYRAFNEWTENQIINFGASEKLSDYYYDTYGECLATINWDVSREA